MTHTPRNLSKYLISVEQVEALEDRRAAARSRLAAEAAAAVRSLVGGVIESVDFTEGEVCDYGFSELTLRLDDGRAVALSAIGYEQADVVVDVE